MCVCTMRRFQFAREIPAIAPIIAGQKMNGGSKFFPRTLPAIAIPCQYTCQERDPKEAEERERGQVSFPKIKCMNLLAPLFRRMIVMPSRSPDDVYSCERSIIMVL